MIARDLLADLQLGDVVELSIPSAKITGELRSYIASELSIAPGLVVRMVSGKRSPLWEGWALTVISRAPRPVYVNHDRTEPVPGDVVRDAEVLAPAGVWLRPWDNGAWIYADGGTRHLNSEMPTRLRLLVDGETGQVVP